MTAEFWQYDARLGRRWNIDPVINPSQASYATFDNNPIYFADPNGLEGEPVNKNDGKGDKGTTAPNGGNRNGDGSISGGNNICIMCGENGQDIYGLPPENPSPNNSPSVPSSPSGPPTVTTYGAGSSLSRPLAADQNALNKSGMPNWLWKLLNFGQGGYTMTSAVDKYIMVSARDKEEERKAGRTNNGLPSHHVNYDELLIPDKSSPKAFAALKFRNTFNKFGQVTATGAQDVFDLTQNITTMFDKMLQPAWQLSQDLKQPALGKANAETIADSIVKTYSSVNGAPDQYDVMIKLPAVDTGSVYKGRILNGKNKGKTGTVRQ